ncbi:LysM peptidoglycan-binding domain-containing protein [Methylorubrum sp. SB2]|uniref:LysM peptidoglycan-binding domain-containing protein n=1 Tax=Methylorubrum subtropicum TaxID=3138812 RepID=UPI00313ECA68
MTTGPRRIILTVLLVALGLLVTLLGRRPRQRGAVPVALPAPVAGPSPAPRTQGRRRGALVAGLAGLLLLAGIAGALFANRDGAFGPGPHATDGERTPLAALSPPDAGQGDAPARGPEMLQAVPPQPGQRAEIGADDAVPSRSPGGPVPDAPPPAQDRRPSSDVPVAGAYPNAASKRADTETVDPTPRSTTDSAGALPGAVDTGSSNESTAKSESRDATRPDGAGHGASAGPRMVLNDPLVAPATVEPDGTVTFAARRGSGPDVPEIPSQAADPAAGEARETAEAPSAHSPPGRDGVERSAAGPDTPHERGVEQDAASQPFSTGSLARNVPTGSGPASSHVHVPDIGTVLIALGDTLWAISRRTYGGGRRYTAIHAANRDVVRDPDLIYPGQILVLPSRDALITDRGALRD